MGHAIYLKVIGKRRKLCRLEKKVVFNYNFPLAEPEVSILEKGENGNKFAEAGSNLNLTCSVRQMSNERKALKWTRDDQVSLIQN